MPPDSADSCSAKAFSDNWRIQRARTSFLLWGSSGSSQREEGVEAIGIGDYLKVVLTVGKVGSQTERKIVSAAETWHMFMILD